MNTAAANLATVVQVDDSHVKFTCSDRTLTIPFKFSKTPDGKKQFEVQLPDLRHWDPPHADVWLDSSEQGLIMFKLGEFFRPLTRRSYEESCCELQRHELLEAGTIPRRLERRPSFGDEQSLGVSFYKTKLGDCVLENLTLPRTFFGRSEIARISFRNSDLSDSVLCWNDLFEVDFTYADLSQCDLRSSVFIQTKFMGANLRDADLRRSTFEACDFRSADLNGAKLTREASPSLGLSKEQELTVDWQDSQGPEPPGG
jgi:hypothetical protein